MHEHTASGFGEAKKQSLELCSGPGDTISACGAAHQCQERTGANTEQVGSEGPLTKSKGGMSCQSAASARSKCPGKLPQAHKLRLQSESEERSRWKLGE